MIDENKDVKQANKSLYYIR